MRLQNAFNYGIRLHRNVFKYMYFQKKKKSILTVLTSVFVGIDLVVVSKLSTATQGWLTGERVGLLTWWL